MSGKGGPGMPVFPPELASLFGETGSHMRLNQEQMNRMVQGQMGYQDLQAQMGIMGMRGYGLTDPPQGVPEPPPPPEPPVCAYCGNPRDDGKKKCPGCGAREKVRNDKPGKGGRRGNR